MVSTEKNALENPFSYVRNEEEEFLSKWFGKPVLRLHRVLKEKYHVLTNIDHNKTRLVGNLIN